MKKTVLIFTVFSLILLSACGAGITKAEATGIAEELYSYIEADDFDSAAGLFHPSRSTTREQLEGYFSSVESTTGVDFSDGISVLYTGFSSSVYDSEVGGSDYELEGVMTVGDIRLELELEIIKKDGIIGINNIELELND